MIESEVARLLAKRIVGLDAWRVMLMLGGLLLHGSLWLPAQPLFAIIGDISHSFRMGAFFAISGYLCGLSMRKRPLGEWLKRRFLQIGLPMLFGWGLLCPVIWIIAHWHPHIAPPLVFDWHHVWFMVALLIYAPVPLVLDRLERRYGLVTGIARFIAGARPMVALLVIALTSVTLMCIAKFSVIALAPLALVPMMSRLVEIAGYFPEYVLGLMMAGTASVACAVRDIAKPGAWVIATISALYAALFALGGRIDPSIVDALKNVTMTGAAAICPVAAFAMIFKGALRIERVPSLVNRLCDASLSMYLLHLPLMLAIHAMMNGLGMHPYVQYGIVVPTVATLSYAFHLLITLFSTLINRRVRELPAAREPSRDPNLDFGSARSAIHPDIPLEATVVSR
jgi:fucose 4-O-acetylase-like acetyltransferase